MKNRIALFVVYFVAWLLFFQLQKPLFMLLQYRQYADVTALDWVRTMWHGLPLDLSLAGYVTALWGLLMLASAYVPNRIIRAIGDVYTGLVLMVAVVAFVADNVLFPYWGFHLDKTVFFYLRTPAEAMASAEWWQMLLSIGAVVLLWGMVFALYRHTISRVVAHFPRMSVAGRIAAAPVFLLLTGLLFLPIRGSVTVSTMNTGRVYFSDNQHLNIAAINPVFHCVESLSENTLAADRYHYMSDAEAAEMVTEDMAETPAVPSRLTSVRPKNVILIIMESFSANVVGCLNDGVGVTPGIDRLAEQGILFTNAYSSSFRTDRGVVAVMSAFPGQPTSSLMMIPAKSQHLPSLPMELQRAGYQTSFFYGGDEDFTNMRSYLVSCGLTHRVCDKSFPIDQRLSKWGVHDHVLLDHAAREIISRPDTGHYLDVILTLSSHEPFMVPATRRYEHNYLNAIAYTDSVVAAFADELQAAGRWDSTLLVLVADHGYPYPDGVAFNSPERYHILMMMTGGAVAQPERYTPICQQTDLVPTILAQMQLPTGSFVLSRNIFTRQQSWAFYSYVDGFVRITPQDTTRVDGHTANREFGTPESEQHAKAYMQCVYQQIEKL